MKLTRRALLASAGALGVGGLAGCSGLDVLGGDSAPGTPAGDGPPLAADSLYLGYSPSEIRDNIVSGGVEQDGIPSVDDPQFQPASEASIPDDDPVFGVVRDGEARAYPQYILVFHEIVNDTVGGDAVAVTYCPLTGTAQGFERGSVEFGVSGRLVNSNLIMYDRGTETWWPQMLATGVQGELLGEALQEFRVTWTTWGEWREVHPGTQVLTEDTGYQRRYGSDPYGAYNPRSGYYAEDDTLFEPLTDDDRVDPKRMVIGTRTADGAVTFDKQSLLESSVLTGTVADTEYVAVAEPSLSTGYVYANPDGTTVQAANGQYRVDGGTYAADSLPLARSLAFDGMWFAWAGFYPEVPYVS
jgi:hypothetical protein